MNKFPILRLSVYILGFPDPSDIANIETTIKYTGIKETMQMVFILISKNEFFLSSVKIKEKTIQIELFPNSPT